MRVDAGVASGARQVLALAEWDVLAVRILVALSQAEIDDVHVVFVRVVPADQEVVWLYISVDDALLVHLLNSLNLIKVNYQIGRVNTIPSRLQYKELF